MAMKGKASENLSVRESKKAPKGLFCLVFLAMAPSKASQRAPKSKNAKLRR